jgi:hypothetical protein
MSRIPLLIRGLLISHPPRLKKSAIDKVLCQGLFSVGQDNCLGGITAWTDKPRVSARRNLHCRAHAVWAMM